MDLKICCEILSEVLHVYGETKEIQCTIAARLSSYVDAS